MLMDTTPSPDAPVSTPPVVTTGGLLQKQALPTPILSVPAVPASLGVPKHFLAAFFLSFFLGIFGADRFYLGYYGQGVLKLLTLGWFGIGSIIDLGIILGGGMRTAKGEPLAGYDEYIGLAKRTIKWMMLGGTAVLIVGALSLVLSWQLLMSSGLFNLLNTGLNAESGGALTVPGASSSPSSAAQQYKDLLKTLQ